ncbi:MAG TPA: hypothetical protein VE935_11845 [Burkholderiales bacterium]|jgi:hypothetical protein|nr:hypothetical protein [Burkholderiales bacterium]
MTQFGVRVAIAACLLAGCVTAPEEKHVAAPPDSTLCDVYGFARGTDAYTQCATEVDKAMWRAARSARARVDCTPMGNQTVCR